MDYSQQKQYRKTLKGRLTRSYYKMGVYSVARSMDLPNFSKKEFVQWALSNGFEELYLKWIENNCDSSFVPSVNRLDDYKPYTFDNMELITWRENWDKSFSSTKVIEAHRKHAFGLPKRCKPVKKIGPDGMLIETYQSAYEAARQNNANQSVISKVCRGIRKSHRGFKWAFLNE